MNSGRLFIKKSPTGYYMLFYIREDYKIQLISRNESYRDVREEKKSLEYSNSLNSILLNRNLVYPENNWDTNRIRTNRINFQKILGNFKIQNGTS